MIHLIHFENLHNTKSVRIQHFVYLIYQSLHYPLKQFEIIITRIAVHERRWSSSLFSQSIVIISKHIFCNNSNRIYVYRCTLLHFCSVCACVAFFKLRFLYQATRAEFLFTIVQGKTFKRCKASSFTRHWRQILRNRIKSKKQRKLSCAEVYKISLTILKNFSTHRSR